MTDLLKVVKENFKIGEELTLFELNETMRTLTKSESDIFEYGREYWFNFSWITNNDNNEGICIEFEIMNPENEDDLGIEVKILEIDEH